MPAKTSLGTICANIFAVILVQFIIPLSAVAESSQDLEENAEFLEKVYRQYQGIENLVGWFEQTTEIAGETHQLGAKFEYAPPNYRLRLYAPEERSVVYDGSDLLLLMPERKRAVRYTGENAGEIHRSLRYAAVLDHNLFRVYNEISFLPVQEADTVIVWQGYQEVSPIGEPGYLQIGVDHRTGLVDWLAVLGLDSSLVSMTYYRDYARFGEGQHLARQIYTVAAAGEEEIHSRVTLSRLRFNVFLPEETFSTSPPAGVQTITNPTRERGEYQ